MQALFSPLTTAGSALRKTIGADDASRAWRVHQRAVADCDAGRFSEALTMSEHSLKTAGRRKGKPCADSAILWNTIGTIREAMQDYDAADSAYRQAAAILNGCPRDDTASRVRIAVLASVARLHRHVGDLERSGRLYVAAIHEAESRYGTDSSEVAGLLSELAEIDEQDAEFADAAVS